MAIVPRKPAFSRPSFSKPIVRKPAFSKPIPQKPTLLKPTFPRGGYERERLRKELERAYTPGRLGQLRQKERIGLEKTLFPYGGPGGYGSRIDPRDMRKAIGKLKKSRIPGGRIAKKRQINLLKRIGGF